MMAATMGTNKWLRCDLGTIHGGCEYVIERLESDAMEIRQMLYFLILNRGSEVQSDDPNCEQ